MQSAKSLDKEITQSLSHLSIKQKKTVLTVVRTFMEDPKDWWDELPKETQIEIDQALKELDKGKGVSHEKIAKMYPQWFKK